LGARIKEELQVNNIDIVDGRPGIFLVEVDGKEIFHNKKEQVKYPDEADVIDRIRKVL
jgi:predicted Rdx family selenoprotein